MHLPGIRIINKRNGSLSWRDHSQIGRPFNFQKLSGVKMVDTWIDSFYRLVSNLGFPDPIHVTLVHIPMGLVIGAFLFSLISSLTARKSLAVTAYYCSSLALLFLFPVIVFGYMDWRHFYLAAWLTPIKIKMVLSVILGLLLLTAFLLGFNGKESSKAILVLYTLCLITIIGLGWFGARIVYGEKTQVSSKNNPIGEKIFAANCHICHTDGGNKFSPGQPLRNSDGLQDFSTFSSLIRHPEEPMPAFTVSRISDKDARELYDYVVNEFRCPEIKGKGR
jgi:uncharacterized membrane protein